MFGSDVDMHTATHTECGKEQQGYKMVAVQNVGQYLHHYKSDDPRSNVLLALIDWDENGAAPDTITGLSDDSGMEERFST